MQYSFKSISLTHKKANVSLRERLALSSEEEVKAFMNLAQSELSLQELLIVSTCNRTEIYYSSDIDFSNSLVKLLAQFKNYSDKNLESYFDFYTETNKTLRYLYEVSVGLHSQVIGDLQIPNQVKQAYQWAVDLNCAGPYLHRLLHSIFYTSKKIAQETAFRDGAASISHATVRLVEDLVISIQNPVILVLGLGQIGREVAENLLDSALAPYVVLMNRTSKKAEDLRTKYPTCTIELFENLESSIEKADVIISSVVSKTPIITPEIVSKLPLFKHKYFIDLSLPRSISTFERNGIILYNIDSIQEKANEALRNRIESIPKVQHIIEESLEAFRDWSQEAMISPTIQLFKQSLEKIRLEEIDRYSKSLSSNELQLIEKITTNIIQKIIKTPIVQLKTACKRGEGETLTEVLQELFNLETVLSK